VNTQVARERGVVKKMAKSAAKTKQFLDKDKRVKAEIDKLKKTFEDLELDERKMKVAESLITNAAFMAVTLEDLQKEINENGVVSEYQNGENQWGTKQSPEAQTYISLINRYNAVMKQLIDLLPEKKQEKAKDKFADFVNNRPD
jgi:dihydroxyacetone kinase